MKHTTGKTASKPIITLGADLSPAVLAIEKAYRMIQRRYKDTPDVTIVIKRDQRAWGHTTVAKVWAPATSTTAADRFEIMISGENLRRGAVAVAGTLLHEAAHARNLANGILDTDSNGRHNQKFKLTAEEHGLTVTERGWHGFAATELEEAGQGKWKALVKTIEAGLRKAAATAEPTISHLPGAPATPPTGVGVGRGTAIIAPPKRGNRNLLKATCGCGHSIRVSRGVLDTAEPTCQVCKQAFTA